MNQHLAGVLTAALLLATNAALAQSTAPMKPDTIGYAKNKVGGKVVLLATDKWPPSLVANQSVRLPNGVRIPIPAGPDRCLTNGPVVRAGYATRPATGEFELFCWYTFSGSEIEAVYNGDHRPTQYPVELFTFNSRLVRVERDRVFIKPAK